MSPVLLIGSLVAVLALVAIASALGLGGGTIEGEEQARTIAEDALPGFRAAVAFVSADGRAALVIGTAGEAALIKQHGAQPALRLLAGPVRAEPDDEGLWIASGDRMFGRVRLSLAPEQRDKLLTLL